MSQKQMMIEVRGNSHRWSFPFYGDPKYLAEWRADGLEVNEVANTIPAWVAGCGLARPWCFVQDIINRRNPFA